MRGVRSRLSGLRVVSARASFAFGARGLDRQRVAGELGVRYVLEGSVRRIGDGWRVNTSLVDTESGAADGPGPRYVLSGIVEITEGGVAERYAAGESFWYSGELPHTAENVDSVPTTVLIVELLPKK